MFPTDLEVEALVASMDEDKSGQIELQELVKHMGLQVGILISRSQISEIPGIISHPDSTEEQTESREGLCRRLQSLRPGWKVSFKDNMRSKKS